MAFRREISDQPASIWSRLAAYLIDALIFIPFLVLVLAIAGYEDKSIDEMGDLVAENSAGFIALLLVISSVLFAYRVLMHRYFGQTLGKMALGIGLVVVGETEIPAWDRLIIRELFVVYAQFIPYAGVYISLGDGTSIFFNSARRSWHDRAAGTEVRRMSDV